MTTLRPARFSDYLAISKLHAESWRQNYRHILSDYYLENEVEQERADTWYKRLQSPAKNQCVTIALLQEDMAGFSCLLLDDDPVFGSLLDNLHVSKPFQKTGIGRKLIHHCAKTICEKAGKASMYLWVYESNTNARKVYERLHAENFETVEKQNDDGTISNTCRYIWEDISVLL